MDSLLLQEKGRLLLTPLSRAYRLLMRFRRRRWERAGSPAFRPACPCLSVGNISWGGTGKTPVVDWLLGWAEHRGLRAVVLTRGYGAHPPHVPLRVTAEYGPKEAGDEPLMLALAHPKSMILVDPNRRRSGHWAEERLAPDLCILDDGFQHVQVRRDLDLVLLRPDDLGEGWERVIPAGTWREGAEALERAGAFLLKCPSGEPDALECLRPALEARLGTGRPVFGFSLRPACAEHLASGEKVEAAAFAGQPYALASGVGEPGQVARTAEAFMGLPPQRILSFPDHHAYTSADAARLEALNMPVVCTVKDAVKLRQLPLSRTWALHVETVFGPELWSGVSFSEWMDGWAAEQGMPSPLRHP